MYVDHMCVVPIEAREGQASKLLEEELQMVVGARLSDGNWTWDLHKSTSVNIVIRIERYFC